MANSIMNLKFGEVILAEVQFVDTHEIKSRPCVVLFKEYGNIVVMAMTSNPYMEGIKVTKQEGAIVDSIIKLNYIFTISEEVVKKVLFSLSEEKKKLIRDELIKKLF